MFLQNQFAHVDWQIEYCKIQSAAIMEPAHFAVNLNAQSYNAKGLMFKALY